MGRPEVLRCFACKKILFYEDRIKVHGRSYCPECAKERFTVKIRIGTFQCDAIPEAMTVREQRHFWSCVGKTIQHFQNESKE